MTTVDAVVDSIIEALSEYYPDDVGISYFGGTTVILEFTDGTSFVVEVEEE